MCVPPGSRVWLPISEPIIFLAYFLEQKNAQLIDSRTAHGKIVRAFQSTRLEAGRRNKHPTQLHSPTRLTTICVK